MKNNGELLFLSEEVPYTCEIMGCLTGHQVTIVEQAIEKCKALELLEEMNNTIHRAHTGKLENRKKYLVMLFSRLIVHPPTKKKNFPIDP